MLLSKGSSLHRSMSALSGGGRMLRPRQGLPSLLAPSSSNFAQYGLFSTASASAGGEKLKDINDLPGPSIEAFFARAMKNNFYDFHVITAELCDQYGDRGLLHIPSFVDPQKKKDLIATDPDVIANIYQRPEFLDRPLAPIFLYAYAHLAQPDPSKVEEDLKLALTSNGREGYHGITTRNGPQWEKHRRIASKALMAPKAVANFSSQINIASKELIQTLNKEIEKKGSTLNVFDYLGEFTFGVITRAALGADAMDLSTPEGQTIYKSVKSFFNAAKTYSLSPYPFKETPVLQELRENMKSLREVFLKLLDKKRKNPAAANDFATMLFLTKDEVTGTYLEPTQVLTDSLDIMNGGTDTTSFLLGMGLHLVAHHPEVAKRIREEVASVLEAQHGDANADITNEDLSKMPFLLATTKEILRLFPSAPLGARLTSKAVELHGYALPAATTVIVPGWAIHRNPKFWPNPTKFDPDRFMEPRAPSHPFVWVPFGAGARSCIGQRLSMAEARIGFAYLLRAFDIQPSDEESGKPYKPHEPILGITAQPTGPVNVKFNPIK